MQEDQVAFGATTSSDVSLQSQLEAQDLSWQLSPQPEKLRFWLYQPEQNAPAYQPVHTLSPAGENEVRIYRFNEGGKQVGTIRGLDKSPVAITLYENKAHQLFAMAHSAVNPNIHFIVYPGGSLRLDDCVIRLEGTPFTQQQIDQLPASALVDVPKKPTPNGVTAQAVVLAGGFGTRLLPITLEAPKPAMPIAPDTTLIGATSRLLAQHGISRLFYHTSHRAQHVRQAMQQVTTQLQEEGVPFDPVEYFDEAKLGTAGELYKLLAPYFDSHGQLRRQPPYEGFDPTAHLLLVQGDSLTNFDATRFLKTHQQGQALITLGAVAEKSPDALSRFGVMVTDSNGTLKQFVEKPQPGTEAMRLARNAGLVNTGIYAFHPEALPIIALIYEGMRRHNELPVDRRTGYLEGFDFGKHLFPSLLDLFERGEVHMETIHGDAVVFDLQNEGRTICYYPDGKGRTDKQDIIQLDLKSAQPRLAVAKIEGAWFDLGDPDSYYRDGLLRLHQAGLGRSFDEMILKHRTEHLLDREGVAYMTREAQELRQQLSGEIDGAPWSKIPVIGRVLNWFTVPLPEHREHPSGNVLVV